MTVLHDLAGRSRRGGGEQALVEVEGGRCRPLDPSCRNRCAARSCWSCVFDVAGLGAGGCGSVRYRVPVSRSGLVLWVGSASWAGRTAVEEDEREVGTDLLVWAPQAGLTVVATMTRPW